MAGAVTAQVLERVDWLSVWMIPVGAPPTKSRGGPSGMRPSGLVTIRARSQAAPATRSQARRVLGDPASPHAFGRADSVASNRLGPYSSDQRHGHRPGSSVNPEIAGAPRLKDRWHRHRRSACRARPARSPPTSGRPPCTSGPCRGLAARTAIGSPRRPALAPARCEPAGHRERRRQGRLSVAVIGRWERLTKR